MGPKIADLLNMYDLKKHCENLRLVPFQLRAKILVLLILLCSPCIGHSRECLKKLLGNVFRSNSPELFHVHPFNTQGVNSHIKQLAASGPGTLKVRSQSIEAEGVFEFGWEDISSFSSKTRGLIRTLVSKYRSSHEAWVEFGSLVVEYSDGTSRAIQFTSREQGRISNEAFRMALLGSGITNSNSFGPDREIIRITHIHTHPGISENQYMTPSPQDIGFFKHFFVENVPEIEFRALIIPFCDDGCDDVVLTVSHEQVAEAHVWKTGL